MAKHITEHYSCDRCKDRINNSNFLITVKGAYDTEVDAAGDVDTVEAEAHLCSTCAEKLLNSIRTNGIEGGATNSAPGMRHIRTKAMLTWAGKKL